MPSGQRPCPQKVQLVAEYGAAVAAYYAAVDELEQGMITGSAEIFASGTRPQTKLA
jgi:hypothetical protein